MIVSKTRKIQRYFTILGLAITLIFTTSVYAFGLLTSQNSINSSGIIAKANIGVFSDSDCTQNNLSMDWGICYPGENSTTAAYIKNLGTVNQILSIQASDYVPSEASTYIILTSDYSGQPLTPGQVLQITFTLRVSPNVTGITNYSFKIIITSQG